MMGNIIRVSRERMMGNIIRGRMTRSCHPVGLTGADDGEHHPGLANISEKDVAIFFLKFNNIPVKRFNSKIFELIDAYLS